MDGTRTIGVQVFDDPDFDPRWSQPVAQSQTQVRLIEHPKYWMTVREVLFKPPWYYEGLYHLRGRVFTMACGERDPWQVMRWANATRYWTITGHDIPREDYGYIFMMTFNKTGIFDITMNATLFMPMPHYPGMEGNRTMIKTGYNTTRIKIMEKVQGLKLMGLKNNNTVASGTSWNAKIFVNGELNLSTVEHIRQTENAILSASI